MRKTLLSLLTIIAFAGYAQPKEMPSVKIGSQIWMIKNLNVSTFANGDVIPQAATGEDWEKAADNKQPAWCYYDNDPGNGLIYGKLYNWFAVIDPRGLAPQGWHVPNLDDWKLLLSNSGGDPDARTELMDSIGWVFNNGKNTFAFRGLPGGYCDKKQTWRQLRAGAFWWSSTESDFEEAKCIAFENLDKSGTLRRVLPKGYGLSVRCVKDE